MPLFDPETGELLDREALRSLQIAPSGRVFTPSVTVTDDGCKSETWANEIDGRPGGVETVHPDGRIDQEIFARPAMGGTVVV